MEPGRYWVEVVRNDRVVIHVVVGSRWRAFLVRLSLLREFGLRVNSFTSSEHRGFGPPDWIVTLFLGAASGVALDRLVEQAEAKVSAWASRRREKRGEDWREGRGYR